MSVKFCAGYAWRSLRRGGQRSAIAVACVAFGVMSLVSLQQLGFIIERVGLVPPRVAAGGDLMLSRATPFALNEALDALTAAGAEAVSPLASAGARWLKRPGSGQASLLNRALGIDPERFPLYGTMELREPPGASLVDLLADDGTAVVTRDLADLYGLALGESFSVFGSPHSAPVHLRVTGVLNQTPAQLGLTVFYSLVTADAQGLRVTQVAARHSMPESAKTELEAAGWDVEVLAARSDSQVDQILRYLLTGTGLLGLLLGAVGVANTMQVLLARRRREIATLKTLGYQQEHLLALFATEAVMLGVLGSALGVALGLTLAYGLMNLIAQTMPFLLSYEIRPVAAAGGVLVGTLTTLIFGMVAIVRASDVRPSMLLRDLPPALTKHRRAQTIGLYAALLVVFALLSSVVLGSWLWGFGVVAAGIVGLIALGAMFAALLWIIARVPMPSLPLLGMARRNLRYQPLRATFAVVALFVGVVAIGFAMIALFNAESGRRERTMDLSGVNIRVFAQSGDEPALSRALVAAGNPAAFRDYLLEAQVTTAEGRELVRYSDVVGRRPERIRWNLVLTDSLSVPPERAAYVDAQRAQRADLSVGDSLRICGGIDTTTVTIAGIFRVDGGSGLDIAAPPRALIVPWQVVTQLAGPNIPMEVSVAAPADRLSEVAGTLGKHLPDAVVIGKDAIANAVNRFFVGFFWFVVAVAALALVAGAILIANAVGLSMLERRRELGILKAVGYTSSQVLGTVVFENALLGLIGGGVGVCVLAVSVAVTNARFSSANVAFDAYQGLLLVAVAVVCAIASAALVAWHPTHALPLAVLRAE